jgi:hypothetical protein
MGVFTAPYFASQRLVLPEIVGEDEQLLAHANSLVEGTTRFTLLLGNAVAGVFIAWLGAANVLWLDAATAIGMTAVAFMFLAATSRAEPARLRAEAA